MAIVAIETAVVGSDSAIGLIKDSSIIAVNCYFPFVLPKVPIVDSS